MGLALFGLKKNFFRPEKKEKARPFAQRKDFLRFRVGFCSKKIEIAEKKQARPFRDRKIVGLALFASGNLIPPVSICVLLLNLNLPGIYLNLFVNPPALGIQSEAFD